MNRRKLFGVLAATPVMAVTQDNREKKLYSVWDYKDIFTAFHQKYLKDKHNINCDYMVFNFYSSYGGKDYYNYTDTFCKSIGLNSITTTLEIREAFASACLNGEIPGVFWD